MKIITTFILTFIFSMAAHAQEPTTVMVPVQIQAVPQVAPLLPSTPLVVDYSKLLEAILTSENQLLLAQQQLLVVEKDTNTQVTQINKTFAQTLGEVGVFVGKYIAPAIISFVVAKKS